MTLTVVRVYFGSRDVLLRHRIFHCRLGFRQRRRNGTVRHRSGHRQVSAVRRTLRTRAVLSGHGLRHNFHGRVSAAVVRVARQVSLHDQRHERHRRRRHPAVLHSWP